MKIDSIDVFLDGDLTDVPTVRVAYTCAVLRFAIPDGGDIRFFGSVGHGVRADLTQFAALGQAIVDACHTHLAALDAATHLPEGTEAMVPGETPATAPGGAHETEPVPSGQTPTMPQHPAPPANTAIPAPPADARTAK